MTTETPAAELRARITRALDECRSMIPAAQADVVLSVLRKATQPEIKAAVLGTSEQADTTADKAAALSMTPSDYRKYRHDAAVEQVREAAGGLLAETGLRVMDALAATEQADTVAAPAVDRATVLHEAADHAESLRQFGRATGARWAAQVSENVGILRVADSLRRLAAEAQQPTPAPAEETKA